MQTHYSSYHRNAKQLSRRNRIRLVMRPRPKMSVLRKTFIFGVALGVAAIVLMLSGVTKTENAIASVTYTTLTNGSWTNTSSVWSTNGSTACGCTPGTTVTDNVAINHDITMNTNLTIGSGGRIDIASTGSLIHTNQVLTINGGTLEAYGPVSIKEIYINSAGAALFHGSVTIVTKFFAEGTVLFDSLTTIASGSLEFKPGSSITAGDGWEIDIPNGNILNEGTVNFQGTCLDINNGSFYNQVGGSVVGYGYLQTVNGNFYNTGTTWSVSVNWCASGTGNGMPQPEYCNDCDNGFVLPVTLIDFNGTVHTDASVILQWATASEINNDYFTLERSSDGVNYTSITRIEGAGNSNSTRHYSFTDSHSFDGILFYRLKQTDYNGESETFKPATINMNGKGNYGTINVFPNPFVSSFAADFKSSSEETVKIKIVSSCGKYAFEDNITTQNGNNTYQFSPPPNFEPGIYLLTVASRTKVFAPVRIFYSR